LSRKSLCIYRLILPLSCIPQRLWIPSCSSLPSAR
jgi:hypothetical protein